MLIASKQRTIEPIEVYNTLDIMKRSLSNIIIIAIVATTLPLLTTASTVRGGGGGVSNDLNTNTAALPNNNINGSGKQTKKKKTRYDIPNKRPAIPDDVSLVDKVRNWNIRQLEYELLNKGGGDEEEESYDDQLPSSSSQQQQQRKLYEGLHHKKSDNGYGTISVEHAPDLGFQHVDSSTSLATNAG